MKPQGSQGIGAPFLTRIEDRLELATAEAGEGRRVELYMRSTLRRRVRIAGGRRPRIVEGHEQGLAVRLLETATGARPGFAAASGSSREAVRRAVAMARNSRVPSDLEGRPWARGSRAPKLDCEPEAAPDPFGKLADRLRELTAGWGGAPWLEAWIESAVTLEGIAAAGSLRAVRSRRRVWAMATKRMRVAGQWVERPRGITSRTLSSLGSLEDHDMPPDPSGAEPAELPLVFRPSAASSLVRFLVRALFTPGQSIEDLETALEISDQPRHEAALSGGVFDDAGFSTRKTVLSDGQRALRTLPARGTQWRSSFRDPPRSRPSCLVVRPGKLGLPDPRLEVTDLRVHPLDPMQWMIELYARPARKGAPIASHVRGFLSAGPRQALAALRPLEAESRATEDNTITPPLLWEPPSPVTWLPFRGGSEGAGPSQRPV